MSSSMSMSWSSKIKCSSCHVRPAYYRCTCTAPHIESDKSSDHYLLLCIYCWKLLEAIREDEALVNRPFDLFIPVVPPGLNATYGYGKGKVFLTPVAEKWSERAALIIGSRAGIMGWRHVPGQKYALTLMFNNWRMDVDAPVKLVQDTVTRKLGFDDRNICRLTVYKYAQGEPGITISLRPLGLEELKYEAEIVFDDSIFQTMS